MASYIHFTDEQKYRANSVDLVDFLNRQGEQLIRAGREWRWKRHDSVTVRGNKWFRHSAGQGGYPIDFVREFFNMSYPEAVTTLLGGECGAAYEQSKSVKVEKKPFALPEANDTMRRVYAYLMKQRFIANDVISYFAREKTLYEDKQYHNAVFVGCDENGVPRHAHKKGTYSEGGSFRGNVDGSDPRYSFRHIGAGDALNVFEAPIDMLSYLTLYQEDWRKQSYVTLGGIAEHAMLYVLERNPNIKKICLCLDHDPAGIEANYRLTEILNQNGYFDVSCRQSLYKDWNEDLKAQNSCAPVSALENPKVEMFQKLCNDLYRNFDDVPEYADISMIAGSFAKVPALAQTGNNTIIKERLHSAVVLALASAREQMRQIEKPVSNERIIDQMAQSYAPHRDRGMLRSRCDDIYRSIHNLKEQMNASGIKTTIEKEKLINETLSLAQNCVKALSFIELEAQKQAQLQEDSPVSEEGHSAMVMM